jgi:hypothetical protein
VPRYLVYNKQRQVIGAVNAARVDVTPDFAAFFNETGERVGFFEKGVFGGYLLEPEEETPDRRGPAPR